MDGIFYKLVAIIFSLTIFAQAYLIRRVVGTYIFPAALLSLMWFFFTFIPLIMLFAVPVNPIAVLYILVCITAFSLSSLPFNWASAYKKNKLKNVNDYSLFNSKFIHLLFYISCGSSILISTISMCAYGFDLYSIFFNLLETSGRFASLRGNGYLPPNNWGKIAIYFTYTAAIFGGFLYLNQNNSAKKAIILVFSFLHSIYFMLTQSSKLIVFYSIGFYFASVLLIKIYRNELSLFSWKLIFRLIGLTFILIPLISVSFLSRDTFLALNDVEKIINHLFWTFKSYAFAQLYAFSDFFSFYLGMKSEANYLNDYYTLGSYTFTSIYNLLGGDKVFPHGVFVVPYVYKDVTATNIFTMFRGLIYDFSGLGVIIFMYTIGLIVHYFFYILLTYRTSWISCIVFILAIVTFQGSYLMSMFMARFMYLIFLTLFGLLWLNGKYCMWIRADKHRKIKWTLFKQLSKSVP